MQIAHAKNDASAKEPVSENETLASFHTVTFKPDIYLFEARAAARVRGVVRHPNGRGRCQDVRRLLNGSYCQTCARGETRR